MTVRENLMLGAFRRKDKEGIQADLEGVLEHFPVLQERRSQSAGSLSGGEQQMLAIGRALMSNPQVLLLDEPSLGLSPILVKSIFNALKEINELGTTILLVEQNAYMALNLAHRGYVMETGQITMTDEAQALLKNPKVIDAYLGG